MAKFYNALILVIAIELSLFMFARTEYTQSGLMQFVISPALWFSNTWIGYIFGAIVAVGALASIVVGSFTIKQDWLWRAGIGATMFSFGYVLIQLWTFISSNIVSVAGIEYGGIIASICVVPLVLYFVFATIDFISGKD